MTGCPPDVTAETLGKPLGSDNVCGDHFAESKVVDPSTESRARAAEGAATVARTIPPFKPQYCLCGNRLTGRQAFACGRSCSGRRGAYAKHRRHPQAGSSNPNWRGGWAADPSYYSERFRRENPEIIEAQRIAQRAVRLGILVRLTFCESCYEDCYPDMHHWDYTQPLRVEWLCGRCHVAADRIRRRQANAAEAGK